MGGWTAAFYTEEQQARLRVTEDGKPLDQPAPERLMPGQNGGGIGPAWTRGEIEKPAGTKDMGGWTAAFYTEEQQARLRVTEDGKPLA